MIDYQSIIERYHQEKKSKEELYVFLLKKGVTVEQIQKEIRYWDKLHRSQQLSEQGVKIIALFGAILVGLGILSFVAANWSGISDNLKIGILVTGVGVCYFLAGVFAWQKMMIAKEAWFVLGGLIYGSSIFLVGQIYNLELGWVNGFLLWGIGLGFAGIILSSIVQIWFFAVVMTIPVIGLWPYLSSRFIFSRESNMMLVLIPVLAGLIVGVERWLRKTESTHQQIL